MADYNFKVTDTGKTLIAECVSDQKMLMLTRISMGNGTYSGTNETATEMQSEAKSLDIMRMTRGGNIAYVHTALLYSDIQTEFQWREVGLFAQGENGKEVLFGYGYAGNKGDWITPGTSATTKRITLAVAISSDANVTALLNDSDNFPAKATEAQADAGTDDTMYMTPAKVKRVLSSLWEKVKDAIKAATPDASTTTKGLVKLSDSTLSTSITTAATSSAVATAYEIALSAKNTTFSKINNEARPFPEAGQSSSVTMPVNFNDSDCIIAEIDIPQWTLGMVVASGGNDGALIGVTTTGAIVTAYRNGGTWGAGHIWDMTTQTQNITLNGFAYNATLYKCGKVVQFINNAGCTSLFHGIMVVIGRIPEGYRPRWDVRFQMCTFDNRIVQIFVDSDGYVRAYNYSDVITSETNAYWSTTWIAAD